LLTGDGEFTKRSDGTFSRFDLVYRSGICQLVDEKTELFPVGETWWVENGE
jgi:hypothetical protein